MHHRIEALRQKLDLEDMVVLTGWVEHAAQRVLPVFDVFFQPSRWEAMSIVILEAMAAGCPVVASNIEGFAGVITHGIEGLLVVLTPDVAPPVDVEVTGCDRRLRALERSQLADGLLGDRRHATSVGRCRRRCYRPRGRRRPCQPTASACTDTTPGSSRSAQASTAGSPVR